MEAIVMVSSQYSSALHTIALSAASSPLALSSALCKSSPYVSSTYLIALFTDSSLPSLLNFPVSSISKPSCTADPNPVTVPYDFIL